MFLISTLLIFGNRIPVVNKFIKVMKIWYGRTTWWDILVKARKAFLILNAVIGVITVFKLTGYSSDNWVAGFYGIGHTYVEMLTSFVKR